MAKRLTGGKLRFVSAESRKLRKWDHCVPNGIVLVFVFLLVCFSQGQDLNAHLSQAQAIHDVNTLVSLLESTHPDPYINIGGKVAFKHAAQQLLKSIPTSGLTVRELDDRLAPFLHRLQDGHTYMLSYADEGQDSDPGLPIRFGVAEDGLFVSAFNVHALDGTQGWRVVGVNGVSLDELRDKWVQRNGGGENRYADLSSIAKALCYLKSVNDLLPEVSAAESIAFLLEAPDGHRETRSVPWAARARWDTGKGLAPTVRWDKVDRSSEIFFYQIFDHPSAAYLCVSTIMGREAYEMAYRANAATGKRMLEDNYKHRKVVIPQDWNRALAGIPSLFDTVVRMLNEMKRRSVLDLVIDLRDNGGGWAPSVFPSLQAIYGDSLYAKPMPGDWVHVESALYLEKYGETPESQKQKDSSFEIGRYVFDTREATQPAEQVRTAAVKEYLDANYSFAHELDALGRTAVYTPRHVLVLVNPGTFSAAFQMMMYLRAMGAKVVGVPSKQSPNAFMETTEFTLPESKLRGSISNSVQIFLPDNPGARVLQPDYPVTIGIYRQYGLDVETPLRYALDLLHDGQLRKAS